MKSLFRLLLLPLFLSVHSQPVSADEPIAVTPDAWAAELHTGILWSVGSNASPLNYTLLPQLLVLKSPAHGRLPLGRTELLLRSRGALEISPIIAGPESAFAGVTFAPSLEWWSPSRRTAAFFSAGGGFGWMDAQGDRIPGGQGQNFNLTWFIHSGVSWRVTDHLHLSLGARYQHLSNGGQNDINPGIDGLGPTLGLSWNW